MPDHQENMDDTASHGKVIHQMTDAEFARVNETALRANKAKIDKTLAELRQKFEETQLMIDRELANSYSRTPDCVKDAGDAINRINLRAAWARHKEEMMRPMGARNGHPFHPNQLHPSDSAATICRAMGEDPGLVLTTHQMDVLRRHFDREDCNHSQN